MRFDLLVANTLKISRNQAAALIKQDKILLRGAVQNRLSAQIAPEQSGEICTAEQIYVSRGALKLAGFLDELAENGLLASGDANSPSAAAEISKPYSAEKGAVSKAAATQKAGEVTTQISNADFAATDKILGANETTEIPSATAAKIAETNTEAIHIAKTSAETAGLLQVDADAETAEISNTAASKSSGKAGVCRSEGGSEPLQTKLSQKEVLNLAGVDVLDVGASTGGFVQILLQRGVNSVTALDVGSSQLSEILRRDPRVIVRENTDIREFASEKKFDLITCDVSFISLNLILKSLASLAKSALIVLFKPQFEVGAEAKRNKKGVLKDEKAARGARAKFERLCAELGLAVLHSGACKITGKEGNQEFFYLLKRMNDEI